MSGHIQIVQSETTKMTQSISQGSVIGCLLFLIYMNDLSKMLTKCLQILLAPFLLMTSPS